MIEQQLYDELCADVLPVIRSMSGDGRYAVALSGSHGKGVPDRNSDFDFRVYVVEAASTGQWEEAISKLDEYVAKWRALGVEIDGFWPRRVADIDSKLDSWFAGKALPEPMIWSIWGYNVLTDIYNQTIIEDPCGIARGWKDRLNVYPDSIRNAILARHGHSLRYWRNDYHYRNKVARNDCVFCASITARLIHDAMQVLYALNRFYYPGDGSNLVFTQKFAVKPVDLETRAVQILYPGDGPDALDRQYRGMIQLIDDVFALPEMAQYLCE